METFFAHKWWCNSPSHTASVNAFGKSSWANQSSLWATQAEAKSKKERIKQEIKEPDYCNQIQSYLRPANTKALIRDGHTHAAEVNLTNIETRKQVHTRILCQLDLSWLEHLYRPTYFTVIPITGAIRMPSSPVGTWKPLPLRPFPWQRAVLCLERWGCRTAIVYIFDPFEEWARPTTRGHIIFCWMFSL